MANRASDEVPLHEARVRLEELAEQVVREGGEVVLSKNGEAYVALVDARKLKEFRAFEAEFEGLATVKAALEGYEDMAAGRLLRGEEIDRALEAPYIKPKQ